MLTRQPHFQIARHVGPTQLLSYLYDTSIFQWFREVRCESKNGLSKDMYSIKIGICAQNLITTIIVSVVNMIVKGIYIAI